MKIDVLLGLQWGDEGKGAVVDRLTPNYDIVARFQGGANAGHTLEFEGKKFVLHLIPSGIFRENVINFLGGGMVIDPIEFQKEITNLTQFIPLEELKKRIIISDRAILIIPTHRQIDTLKEAIKSTDGKNLGTTGKGIGPAYTDNVSRDGLRIGDILSTDFEEKFDDLKSLHCRIYRAYDRYIASERTGNDKIFLEAVEFLRGFQIVDGVAWIHEKLRIDAKILAEGAQGSMLDISLGCYPFVTSSNTTIGGVMTGLGVNHQQIGRVYGLFKAYCTRVGEGPFPTELGDERSAKWCRDIKRDTEISTYPDADINSDDDRIRGIALRTKGYEYGATTGRLRRTGWLDLNLLHYACQINGVTDLIISKADVLVGMKEIKLYDKSKSYVVPGWGSLNECKNFDDLPIQFKDYLSLITAKTNIQISMISTGPERQAVIIR